MAPATSTSRDQSPQRPRRPQPYRATSSPRPNASSGLAQPHGAVIASRAGLINQRSNSHTYSRSGTPSRSNSPAPGRTRQLDQLPTAISDEVGLATANITGNYDPELVSRLTSGLRSKASTQDRTRRQTTRPTSGAGEKRSSVRERESSMVDSDGDEQDEVDGYDRYTGTAVVSSSLGNTIREQARQDEKVEEEEEEEEEEDRDRERIDIRTRRNPAIGGTNNIRDSDASIHAPQPRRLNTNMTERSYTTSHSPAFGNAPGSPSPGASRYSSALPDSNRPSPTSTPTPGGGGLRSISGSGGGVFESSQSAASKRREANRLAAARFRTRKKDQVTELEGKVAVLEAENANLKAENEVWRSGRDGNEWAKMRSSLVLAGGGRKGLSAAAKKAYKEQEMEDDAEEELRAKEMEEDDAADLAAADHHRQDSDEILPRVNTPGIDDQPDPLNPSAAGKKRRKTAIPPYSSSTTDSALDPSLTSGSGIGNLTILSSSTESASATTTSSAGGQGFGGGAVEEENRRLVEQMRRYESVMEGMRGEMREYRERLGMVNKSRAGRAGVDAGDRDERPYAIRSSSSYETDPGAGGVGSPSGYASSTGSNHHPAGVITLPPIANAATRHAMSREGSSMSLHLPPLSPGLRFASPVHSLAAASPSTHHAPYVPGSGFPPLGSPGGIGFSMATLADAAAATGSGATLRLQQHQQYHSRPASPLAALSSSPSNSGPLSKFAALTGVGGPGRASLDRSRSWTGYSPHPSPGADAVSAGGMNRLNLLASGRDSPVSAERGTAMDDDEEDGSGARATATDEPMEYFDRRIGSGLKIDWERRHEEDVRMRSRTGSPPV